MDFLELPHYPVPVEGSPAFSEFEGDSASGVGESKFGRIPTGRFGGLNPPLSFRPFLVGHWSPSEVPLDPDRRFHYRPPCHA